MRTLTAALLQIGWPVDPLPAVQRLAQLRGAAFVRRLDAAGRRRLQALLPQLLMLIAPRCRAGCHARAGAENH